MSEHLHLASKHAERLKKMRRGVLLSARAIHNDLLAQGYEQWSEENAKRWGSAGELEFRCALLTLTYRPDAEWQPNQLKELLSHYRKWAKRNKCVFSYVWTMEPQGNGRPHYHVVFWMSGGKVPPLPDKQGWWPHGMSNAQWAHSPVGYIAKYASKGNAHQFPEDARIWGAGGLSKAARAERAWCLAPKWLRGVTEPGTLVRKVKTAITETFQSGKTQVTNVMAWVCSETQNAFFSPWEFLQMTATGPALRHKGFIEVFAPCGDHYKLKHINPMENAHAH